MGPDRRRRPPRRRDAGAEAGLRSRPRSVPSGRRPRERIGLPDALPARHSAHRALATARRGSRRVHPLRPLSRAPLWPLVPQGRSLQKRPPVLLRCLPGEGVQKEIRKRLIARGKPVPPLFATRPCVSVHPREVHERSVVSDRSPETCGYPGL